ncbi:MAG: N-dimethylarginine dimethylaminohydrolase [Gammaproteobacteria bacterium]|jgi:N-dimethylarginine dimethylaminohydrolase
MNFRAFNGSSSASALTYPTEAILLREYADYIATLEKLGVEVLFADPEAAYSFDYTCPRDIGFVIGDTFFIANMAVQSRSIEIETIKQHLEHIDPDKIVRPPNGSLLEGGDVILLDPHTVLVGINQRSNQNGFKFLKQYLAPSAIAVIPVRHSQLHLDCCLNPLGMGHMLIHSDSLQGNDEATWDRLRNYAWIEVDAIEREHLATNILSIDPVTVIARSHPACARVNNALKALGYIVETIGFDGVPATRGSFRCASLVLKRLDR